MAKVTDPVCGMQIDSASAAAQSNYQGQSYYFCTESCKRQFDADPRQFVGAASQTKRPEHRPEL